MRVIATLIAVGLAAAFPAAASNPGEPLDCSDWVFSEPGLSCTTRVPDCTGEVRCFSSDAIELTNEGRHLYLRSTVLPVPCWANSSGERRRTELIRHDGITEQVLAYVEDRCKNFQVPGTTKDSTWPNPLDNAYQLKLDHANGTLLVPLNVDCATGDPFGSCNYGDRLWLAAIEGFAPLVELAQSFTPAGDSFSFTTPAYPEGLDGADYFDTYTGDLAMVGDWSQAQALQCGYPVTAPNAGEFVTIADTLPDPAPGTGRYYVTAVTYQGQTRYGRKANGGVVSGRDPAVLPACQ